MNIGLLIAGGGLAQGAAATGKPVSMVYKICEDGTKVSADVYHAGTTEGLRPVVVWYHGGALMFGSRSGVPKQLIDLSKKENLILVSMDYRLAPGARIDEIVSDVKDGLQWLKTVGVKRFGVDSSRMLVAGASAGGYLTLMSGIIMNPPPKALISYWGFGDIDGDWCNAPNENYGKNLKEADGQAIWKAVGKQVLTQTNQKNGRAQSNLFLDLKGKGGWGGMMTGHDPKTDRDKMAPYSPIRNLTPAYPPVLLLHGTKDDDVPYERSTDMAKALEKVGVENELITIEGGGHGLWGGDKKLIEAAFQRSLDYIREQLVGRDK